MSDAYPNGYYWYIEDDETSELCKVEPDGIYDVYFIGSEVGMTFDELEGTLEPVEIVAAPGEGKAIKLNEDFTFKIVTTSTASE